ncbi:hypothetical protein [Methylobacter marinus]|uniref:hypothetical protein n=1 Tax=Methylobacter marinus TaxID=34058 RepID=UPI00037A83B8|nr:hypothetical protein [Methylobacter marinus]
MWVQVVLIIIQLIAMALSVLLAPKPKAPEAQALENVPQADPSRFVPVLFGKRTFKSANIVWYGDRSTRPHKVSQGKK